jgi:protein O-GlcNAc transferase
MPHSYICFSPSGDEPAVGPLPALTTRRVTFGCFNNPAKFSAGILNAWAAILQRTPDSQLLLKYGGLDDAGLQREILSTFFSYGIEPERIMFEGWSDRSVCLAAYNRVDLALDTQPYSGGLTTCESLWMGVPVITFPGRTFASRHATSHLANAGYPQFIASDPGSYIERAVWWANHLDELSAIRLEMRDTIRRSALCNSAQFATEFSSVMRQITPRPVPR